MNALRAVLVQCLMTQAVIVALGGQPLRRIAFGSCNNQLREGIFSVISSYNPDQLILLGDNVYVDKKKLFGFQEATPEQIDQQYCILNGDLSWMQLVKTLGGYDSIYATWDDHDFGINNGDSSYRYRDQSLNSFYNFFRVDLESPRRSRDGVYHSSRHEIVQGDGNILSYKIITLDTRYNLVSQRSGAKVPDMLGAAQWEWLALELADANVDIILLGSSVQILPTDKLILESWYFHDPIGRERLLSLVANSPCQNIILLSGDIHEAEVSQASCLDGTRKLYELTSSGLTHSFTYRAALRDTDSLMRRGCDENYRLHDFETLPLESNVEEVPLNAIDVHKRGFIFTAAHSMYEAVFPSHFREQRFGHHYGNLHFGLLDIIVDPSDSATSNSLGHLRFSVINQKSEEVLSFEVPLIRRISCFANASCGIFPYKPGDNVCAPYWGPIPVYKGLLLHFFLMTPVVIFVFFPIMYIVWLLVASVYYIFWVSELKRRERIEAHWRKIKKI